MTVGRITRQVLPRLAIIVCTLFVLFTTITHAVSRTSVFPNPNVPYQIPADESPKEQALYLYEVLKEHDYSKLEIHLRKYVPELKKIDEEDIEPLDDIVTLVLTATNPEVEEAFDLMIKGGRRGWGSFNTELQILFWLAEQNEFNKDDTLAQAIAMVNGLWVAIGTDDVSAKVKVDTNNVLSFGRKTSKWQRDLGLAYSLESYPLEAMVAWAWTGNYAAMSGRDQHLPSFKNKRLPLWAYEWLNVSELDRMREKAIERGWVSTDVNSFISRLEWFFYFSSGGRASSSKHWIYEGGNEKIVIDGRKMVNHDTSNADFLFNFFLDNGYVIGDCGDETVLINAFAISCGIATNPISYKISFNGRVYRHFYNLYFDPKTRSWKAYEGQVGQKGYPSIFDNRQNTPIQIYINRPPIDQREYLRDTDYTRPGYKGKTVYKNDSYTIDTLRDLLTKGIPTKEMKKWLLGR